ncbi:MAG TPA: hypothetical protein VHS36_08345 [Candidatus Limnocylindrales bacterium]|jgi:hypothetical protein|nr:hypothetical protein [Candidatus Limnocylindrales bacterium]
MDPRDDLGSPAGGVDCAACGSFVPTDRIRVLARRDDISFVELDCPSCRSESLGILIAEVEVPETDAYGEFGPSDAERFRVAPPIGTDDLHVARDLMARGGLAALVGRPEPPAGGPGR